MWKNGRIYSLNTLRRNVDTVDTASNHFDDPLNLNGKLSPRNDICGAACAHQCKHNEKKNVDTEHSPICNALYAESRLNCDLLPNSFSKFYHYQVWNLRATIYASPAFTIASARLYNKYEIRSWQHGAHVAAGTGFWKCERDGNASLFIVFNFSRINGRILGGRIEMSSTLFFRTRCTYFSVRTQLIVINYGFHQYNWSDTFHFR